MKKGKIVYEAPKVSKLDDFDPIHGGIGTPCEDGTGADGLCVTGNQPAQIIGFVCEEGSDPHD